MKFFLMLLFLFNITLTEIYDGFTLYTPSGNETTFLMDKDWNIINTWSHDCGPASMPYLVNTDQPGIENSLLYYPCKNDNPIMESGGVGGAVKIYDWEGELLWEMTISGNITGTTSSNMLQHHHDIEPLANGNFLIVAWERLYSSEWQQLGVESVNNSLNQMWTTAILEIDPDFQSGSYEIVWEWYIKDHLVQDRNPELENYGLISDHPELMDANCGNIGSSGGPGGDPNGDWMHINAIDYNEHLDQIVISSRFQDEIYIIDHSTTTEEAAGHTGGNSGKGGDFLYRWGNPLNYNRGNSSDEWLGDQHSINWIKDGYPGQGNLICYVNRYNGNLSAVVEFSPPLMDDGNYFIEDGEPFGPSSLEWVLEATNNFNFSTNMQGGSFRLPNGNTIITDCDSSLIYEVDSNGSILTQYDVPGQVTLVARAEKYDPEYFNFANAIPGDINLDELVNVLDIVQAINMILGIQNPSSSADLNDDGNINVLDVVLLVNLIIN